MSYCVNLVNQLSGVCYGHLQLNANGPDEPLTVVQRTIIIPDSTFQPKIYFSHNLPEIGAVNFRRGMLSPLLHLEFHVPPFPTSSGESEVCVPIFDGRRTELEFQIPANPTSEFDSDFRGIQPNLTFLPGISMTEVPQQGIRSSFCADERNGPFQNSGFLPQPGLSCELPDSGNRFPTQGLSSQMLNSWQKAHCSSEKIHLGIQKSGQWCNSPGPFFAIPNSGNLNNGPISSEHTQNSGHPYIFPSQTLPTLQMQNFEDLYQVPPGSANLKDSLNSPEPMVNLSQPDASRSTVKTENPVETYALLHFPKKRNPEKKYPAADHSVKIEKADSEDYELDQSPKLESSDGQYTTSEEDSDSDQFSEIGLLNKNLTFERSTPATPEPNQKQFFCNFCWVRSQSNFGSHNVRNKEGKITCPKLFHYVCPICGATGDNAHTGRYCPNVRYKKHVTRIGFRRN